MIEQFETNQMNITEHKSTYQKRTEKNVRAENRIE